MQYIFKESSVDNKDMYLYDMDGSYIYLESTPIEIYASLLKYLNDI